MKLQGSGRDRGGWEGIGEAGKGLKGWVGFAKLQCHLKNIME